MITNRETRHESLASYVKRLGHPVSTTLLTTACQLFTVSHIDGVIAYMVESNCAIVMGDPICQEGDWQELSMAFHLYCQEHGWNEIYLLTSKNFAYASLNTICQIIIQVGEHLFIDPTDVHKDQKLRWKINHARHLGISVEEYLNDDSSLATKIKNAMQAWLNAKRKFQVYLEDLDFSLERTNRRLFYARSGDTIIGALLISRIDHYKGWVVNYFFATSKAPAGTTEYLMATVFDILAQEGCHFLALGATAASNLSETRGLNKFSKCVASILYKIAKWLFRLDSKKIYLKKFHPTVQPAYLLFSNKIGLNELMALKKILHVKL